MYTCKKGIVAAGHHHTAKAAAEVLDAGGNAYDAVLAAMFASFVAESTLSSLGGGGFLNYYTADKQAGLIDFFVQTPLKRPQSEDVDFHLNEITYSTATQQQYIGRASVAVPGIAAGIDYIHQRFATMPLAEIAAPAIQLAREGVVLTAIQAYFHKILKTVLAHGPEMRQVFTPENKLLLESECLYHTNMAGAMEHLTRVGMQDFYRGEIAEIIVKDQQQNGGLLTREDLEQYEIALRKPLRATYKSYTLLTNPPPSAGGSMIREGLKHLALPVKHPLQHLVNSMRAMELYRKKQLNLLGNTTHISVMDCNDNVASSTITYGGASGNMIPGTGIPTNNMLGEADLNPAGFHQWMPNTRVSSMMSPSIVIKDEVPYLALGSAGSSRIRTAILQTLYHVLEKNMPLDEAVNYPRAHWEEGLLHLEPGLTDSEDLGLDQVYQQVNWKEKSLFFGGLNAAQRLAKDSFFAAADPRRDGRHYAV